MTFQPKAICLDMDGTLLNHYNELSARTIDVIQEIRKRGIKVFIVTGRSYNEIFDSAPKEIILDGFVTANGMVTYRDGGKIKEEYLPLPLIHDIITSARENNIYYEVHPNDSLRIALEEDSPFMKEMVTGEKPEDVGMHEWLERQMAMKTDINWQKALPEDKYSKMYCFSNDSEKMANWIKELNELKKKTDFTTSSSSPHNVEVMLTGINKASGIKALLDHFNIHREDTMAIGDSNNDIPMMEYVGYGVAMKNATDEIKEITKDETAFSNHEDGVYQYLKKYFDLADIESE
ncbi:Cof-type HAD-IIB family hydrolase [Saliterribacillus persicus]|uniref:Cof subfamily protein (Haloacid dehalogenase superfamily)/HAD superfamily hydrolase (TIGR01484 family) n=1 Tax=Saliterribacillus persicus TaxID=930114 RepID=A0A368XCS9_9BACI|nr:Cof-type HAD-IIB family hydrolase [Saliterribacillus persicus]RCW64247.1 hypothetical protein DFR57_11434 [Saliterribacillus persicus]